MVIKIINGSIAELKTYFKLSVPVQMQLISMGLNQYVPSAHKEYYSSFHKKQKNKEFYCIRNNNEMIGGFCISAKPSEWWVNQSTNAVYLSNLLICQNYQGQNIGKAILDNVIKLAKASDKQFIRLDCFSESHWLCNFYENYGFKFIKKVKQHINYYGNLYEYKID